MSNRSFEIPNSYESFQTITHADYDLKERD